MNLSVRELRVVRAAILLALEGDDSAWHALSSSDTDLAVDLLDTIPDMPPAEDMRDDGDDEDDGDEDY